MSEAPIRFLLAGSAAENILNGELLDASPIGVRLRMEEPLVPQDKLLVEVRNTDGRCFNLAAEVMWCEPAGLDGFHVGCFLQVEMSAKQFARLNHLAAMSRNSAAGANPIAPPAC